MENICMIEYKPPGSLKATEWHAALKDAPSPGPVDALNCNLEAIANLEGIDVSKDAEAERPSPTKPVKSNALIISRQGNK